MPQIRFEGLTQSIMRLPDVIRTIPDIIANPAANPVQAAILLGIVFVLLLIVLISVLLIVVRPSRMEQELFGEPAVEETGEQRRPFSWITVLGAVVLVFAVLWVVTGITTSSQDVCTSCHIDTPHDLAPKGGDPHATVACVSCHETGGPVARATVNLPLRVQHFVLGRVGRVAALGYGKPAASDACLRCHADQIGGTVVDRRGGMKVAHKQPLAAGAQCVDCHVLENGVITRTTVGMSPCLRCHNGQITSADCNVCHIGDPTDQIRAKQVVNAAVQVPNPQCGSCHFDQTECDACHGLRMPHTQTFMAYGHARPAAENIWFGNGKLCQKCHYPGHRDCLNADCHIHSFPIPGGHPNPAWATLHTNTGWSTGWQTGCACHKWNVNDHNGMVYCQVCHPVKPPGAAP